jgi:hypothetical protein
MAEFDPPNLMECDPWSEWILLGIILMLVAIMF